MNIRGHLPFEKLAAGAALGLLLASAGWWAAGRARVSALRRLPVTEPLRGGEFQPVRATPPAVTVTAWPRPSAQSAGSGWVYDLFTPPPIYYHAGTGAFRVTPSAPGPEGQQAFGLTLLEVKRAPYRLQLVGYVGAPGDYLAAFVSPLLPEMLLARAGRRFAELGLALRSFSVGRVPPQPAEAGALGEIAATAVLEDERSGEIVVLDSRTRRLTDTPLAVLRLEGGAARPHELREGDTCQADETRYRVERIQLNPPEVLVARFAPDQPHPETRVLRPAEPPARTFAQQRHDTPASRPPEPRAAGWAQADPRP